MSEHKVKILKEFDDGSLAINCAFCGGSGQFPNSDIDDESQIPHPCSVCQGKGFNTFQATRDNLVSCGLCEGSGKAWDEDGYFFGEKCRVCHGKGVFLLTKRQTKTEYFWSLLHPRVTSVAQDRFRSRHYADAVEAAFKEINTRVKEIVKNETGKEFDGVAAIEKAFSLQNPIIKIADLTTESGRNIQKGYLQIFSGSIVGIRNPKAHENIAIDRNQAIHFLFLASLLMSKIAEG